MHDLVIIGAGPAGATAAALLAGGEGSVLLVDAAPLPRAESQTVWVSALALPLLEKIGLDAEAVGGRPFTDMTFYNADLSKSAKPRSQKAPGYVVRRGAFDAALLRAALDAGAELRTQWPVTRINLSEEHVELTAENGDSLRGRMLLAAMGHGSELTERITKSRQVPTPHQWTAKVEVEVEVDLPKPAQAGDSASVILGLDRPGAFGLLLTSGSHLAVSVCGRGGGEEGIGLLMSLCQRLHEQGILGLDLAAEAARASVVSSPAGLALEMDSHVAKLALIIGDAGGFVSATSQEGIYPAMWSARLAVEVLERALDSKHSQDVLMEFDSKWRMAMADYLRPPNTDIQFLLPLIFSNQPMADRMGAAFFLGQGI